MDLDFTAADREFRDEVRTWLRDHVPREVRPHDGPAMRDFDLGWQRTQHDAGWAGVSWPVDYGGRGLSLTEQMIWFEEYAAAGAPWIGCCFVGINHGGPTLIARGTGAQKAFHLPRILRGDVVWCQGFSEPNAGSDLASLTTRASVDDDHLVVSGQKTWTSFAHLADYKELLVRTDPASSRQRGLTWAICDMHAPGIEVRPIRSMEGDEEFCEVFYDEVRIPVADVVGELGDGWSVAMATLGFERGTGFMAEQVQLARTVERLVEVARTHVGPDRRRAAIADDEVHRRLATARAEVAALRAMTYAGISRARREGTPGVFGSMTRLYHGELTQRVQRLAIELLGPAGLRLVPRHEPDGWSGAYLRSYASTIGAGTSDIQRNIVGERVLGLAKG